MVGQWQWPVLAALVATVVVGAALRCRQRPPDRLPRVPGPDRHAGHLLRLRCCRALDEQQRARSPPSRSRTCTPSRGRSASPARGLHPDLPLQVAHVPGAGRRWSCGCWSTGWSTVAGSTPWARTTSPPVSPTSRCAGPGCWPTSPSGLLSGIVAVVTVAQFASARPDAGSVGNGMALPAITIAVLGGVAITGGVGRVPASSWPRCSWSGSTPASCWPSRARTAASSSCSRSGPAHPVRPAQRLQHPTRAGWGMTAGSPTAPPAPHEERHP